MHAKDPASQSASQPFSQFIYPSVRIQPNTVHLRTCSMAWQSNMYISKSKRANPRTRRLGTININSAATRCTHWHKYTRIYTRNGHKKLMQSQHIRTRINTYTQLYILLCIPYYVYKILVSIHARGITENDEYSTAFLPHKIDDIQHKLRILIQNEMIVKYK